MLRISVSQPLCQCPSKLIKTGARHNFHSQSLYPVKVDVFFIFAIENIENRTVFDVFSGYRKETWTKNELFKSRL